MEFFFYNKARFSRPKKPLVLRDIERKGESVWQPVGRRLNLSYREIWPFPFTTVVKSVVVCSVIILSLFGFWVRPTVAPQRVVADSLSVAESEREVLQAQLRQLEEQIDQYEDQIIGYQKQGSTLKNEIAQLNNKIAKLNLQIQATTLTLKQLNSEIAGTRSQIAVAEGNINDNKTALGALIRNLYVSEQSGLLEVLLKNPSLSDFFNDLNSAVLFQDSLRVATNRIADLRDELQDKEQQLNLAKSDAQSVKDYQTVQKQEIDLTKSTKNQLLVATKGQESRYQTLLAEAKKNAAQIRSRIFELLGGGELSFEQAYQYAKLANDAIGVRPALLLAVLDRESALGQNVGRCGYKTAMSPKNQPIFLDITRELNIDPDSVTVSCPNKDGVYGGAMGPAQFVPSTWKIYSDKVSKITGHSPASPWNNADAFVATALYLKDLGAVNGSISAERAAAAKYYAGSRWRNYLWTYGEAVISRAKSFQEDIDTITG